MAAPTLPEPMFVLALVVGLLWAAIAVPHVRHPATMFRVRHWPFGTSEPPGRAVRTNYRRLGYVLGAIAVGFLGWGLLG